MPAAPSEPEKYSIDEMMERLKCKPAGDPEAEGELVTRPDGTQAIRVRKRKRRSSQPHKEKAARTQRARIVQLSAALVLLMTAALVVGGAIIYVNSSVFRDNIVGKITAASGAQVELRQFRMSPTSANASSLSMAWPEGNVLDGFDLRMLKATVHPASILGGPLAGEEATAVEGNLRLRTPVAGQPLRMGGRGEGPLPVNFKRLGIGKLNITHGGEPRNAVRLLESEGSFYPSNVKGRPELRINRGNLTIPEWPALRMDRAFIEFRGLETDIISMRLMHEKDENGILMLSGTVRTFSPDLESTLVAQLESFPIAGIAGPLMGRFFGGRIDSLPGEDPGTVVFRPAEPASGTLSAPFQTSLNSYLQLTGFPFLRGLAQTLEDKWFETPLFEQDSTGILERTGASVRIRDFQAESKGRLAVRGDVRIDGAGKLAGELQVGVATAMIASAPTRRLDAMFSEDRAGFRWLTITLGGSATAPTDDFRELFSNAESPREPAVDAPSGPGPSFEDLTRPR